MAVTLKRGATSKVTYLPRYSVPNVRRQLNLPGDARAAAVGLLSISVWLFYDRENSARQSRIITVNATKGFRACSYSSVVVYYARGVVLFTTPSMINSLA